MRTGRRGQGLVPGGFPVPGQQLTHPGVRQLGDAGEDIGDRDQLPDGGVSDPLRTPTIVLCPQYCVAIGGSATATIRQVVPPCAHSGPGRAPRTRRAASRSQDQIRPPERQRCALSGASMPCSRTRVPRVSSVSPAMSRAGPESVRSAVAPSSVLRTTPTRSTSQCATRCAADPMATATRPSVFSIPPLTERIPRQRVRRIPAPSSPCLPDGAPPAGRRRPNSTPDDRAHRSRAGEVLRERGTSASVLQFQARRTNRARVACGRRELAAATPTPLLRHTPFQPVKVPVALAHVASRRSPGASGQAPSRGSGVRAGPPARGHGCRMRTAFQPMATPPDGSAVPVPTPLSRARVPAEAGRRRSRRGF